MKKYLSLAMMSIAAFLAFFGFRTEAFASLEVGAPVPKVQALNQDGETVDFAAICGKGMTVIYFYPKADTPGCTKEACSFRDRIAEITAKGVTIIGVSEDPAPAQKSFQSKYHLPFDLIADSNGKVAEAFGVPTLLGMTKRQTFLIQDGVVVWRDLNAATEKAAEDVLKVIQTLEAKVKAGTAVGAN